MEQKSQVTYVACGKAYTEEEYAKDRRAYYLKHLPEGYDKDDILAMIDDHILDLDYFLNE